MSKLSIETKVTQRGHFLMKRISQCLFLWALGGCIYYGIEVTFRGFSHWSMFVLGGTCMVFFWLQGYVLNWQVPLWLQIIRCVIFVTAGEFITGIIVNKWFNLAVWDYSDQPFNILGQVCLPFVIIFSGLCVIGIFLSGYLIHWLYQEPKPKYFVIWEDI